MSESLIANHEVDNMLSLTEVRSTDTDSIVEHINDKEIYDNTLTVPFPYGSEDAEMFVKICRKFEELNEHICNYAIRLEGEMIGGIGFLYNHGPDAHKSEFGYWIGKSYRNRGIMTSVIRKFIEIAFEEKYIHRLEAHVFPNNVASQKILERIGFTKEGLIKSNFVKDDRLRDSILYSIVKPTP